MGRWVPYALFHHLLQLARSMEHLIGWGYSEEALPIGRAMLSAAAHLIFIVRSGNPEGWALRYWLQVVDLEQRMLDREIRLQRFDPAVLERIKAEATAAHDQAISDATASGVIYPDKLDDPSRRRPRNDTWTGLSDKALFESLGLADWYETEYDYLSTITHVQAVTLLPLRDELMAGQRPTLGPHFRPPLPALTASFNALKFASLAVVRHFNLVALLPRLDAASAAMSASVERYREATGANSMVGEVFGTASPADGDARDDEEGVGNPPR